MADNTTLSAPVGTGDTVRDKDRAGVKTPVVGIDLGIGTGTESLMAGTMPTDPTTTSVADGGTLPAKGVQVGGTDGTVFQVLSTDNAGRLNTNVNGTVPVSASSLPLPTGASTAAKQPALGTAGSASADVLSVQGVASMTALKTDGSGVTQPVSAGALPLPSGASTAAKQPALGTAGTPSADVLTVQGAAVMTALKVDGSGATQPVSGTVTADTELPAAAALSDTAANPTAPAVGAFSMLWDNVNSTWARQLASPGTGLAGVDVSTLDGNAVSTSTGPSDLGTQRVVLGNTQPTLTVDGSGVTQPTNLTKVAGTALDVNSGTKSAGTQRVVIATDQPALTNALKVDPSAVTSPVSLASLPALVAGTANIGFVTPTPGTTGGWSKVKYAAQTTTKQAVKASAGTFGGYFIWNPNSTVAYMQVFDLASASVTLGTTAPDMIFAVPPTSAANLELTLGVNMANAITLACTTTATGSTAPSTGLDMTIFFK